MGALCVVPNGVQCVVGVAGGVAPVLLCALMSEARVCVVICVLLSRRAQWRVLPALRVSTGCYGCCVCSLV